MLNELLSKENLAMLYKKTSVLYGLFCGGAVAPVAFAHRLNISVWLGIVIAAVILVLGTIVSYWLAGKITARICRTQFEELEPERALRRFERELSTKKATEQIPFAALFVSQSYLTMGEFKSAEQTLMAFLNKSDSDKGKIETMSMLVTVYTLAAKPELAVNAYKKLEGEISGKTLTEGEKLSAETAKYTALLAAGKPEECIDYFKAECATQKLNLRNVTMSFRLGEAYAALGNEAEAEHAYRIVAENGKDIYVARAARQRLNN